MLPREHDPVSSERFPLVRCHGFTLVELLAVIAIMIVLSALVIPAFTSLGSAGGFNKAVYDLAGTLEQARAYAMANNTYVFVGIEEVIASAAESVRPQPVATASAGGRVAVAVVAAKNGTRGYDVNDPGDGTTGSWVTSYANGASLTAINKLQRLENLHIAVSLPRPKSGTMLRPAVSGTYTLGDPSCRSVTPFTWPLGSPLTGASSQYRFDKVIQFDPQGVARIQTSANADAIVTALEIDLLPARGATVVSGSNCAAIQVDCMTGSTRIYRP